MPKSIILFIIMSLTIFRMGDSFRSAAWDSQLDNMLDDLQQVVMMMMVEVVMVEMVEMVEMVIMMVILKGLNCDLQSVQSGHSDTSRITNGHTNGHSSHEYQVF